MYVYPYSMAQSDLNLIARAYYLVSNTTFLSSVWSETCILDSHDSKYCECYTQAPGAIPEFPREILMNTRYDYYEDYFASLNTRTGLIMHASAPSCLTRHWELIVCSSYKRP